MLIEGRENETIYMYATMVAGGEAPRPLQWSSPPQSPV
jgi:hypothetical protein